ncbi:hypothetical protein CH63R_01231 [Colletotrichum higginsianum IMI 349063]|uniref:Uncharacterized protein n=1 Tax=Colletotrichum higginsianum (strain IMI 349063) TaxID=759273 RepID=A0A1B7YVH2_COLHI|nr:hypothetical protein CH63R_01231 [Colletotrichum higginsianum IMI 349063]OBR16051.1 hypothetical protein CH63R_01231 [Colletotrichum higginsianum IMI 349063]
MDMTIAVHLMAKQSPFPDALISALETGAESFLAICGPPEILRDPPRPRPGYPGRQLFRGVVFTVQSTAGAVIDRKLARMAMTVPLMGFVLTWVRGKRCLSGLE